MKQQTADKILEWARRNRVHRNALHSKSKAIDYDDLILFLNFLGRENEQYTCKKCGAGWSDDTDTEIALREMNRYLKFCGLSEADKIIVSLYFHWLSQQESE